MQYSWLPDTRRTLHWRKTALSSVMSFHPSYLTHTACFCLPDKADICLSFPINAGVLWEKPRWHVQSQERGCHQITTRRLCLVETVLPSGRDPQRGFASPLQNWAPHIQHHCFFCSSHHMWLRLCASGARKRVPLNSVERCQLRETRMWIKCPTSQGWFLF